MMRRALTVRSLVLISSLLLVASAALLAEETQTPEQQIQGTVVSVGDEYLVIDTDSGQQQLMIDDQSVLPSTNLEGNTVNVSFREVDGTPHLTAISVTDSTMASKSDASSAGAIEGASENAEQAQQETQVASNSQETNPARDSESATRELPSTASHLPLLASIGALSVLLGLAIRFSR